MERLLIVNADDFGLSKGQNYGIIEACRNGVVTSTTALVNGEAIYHAAQLSRDEPTLAVGMHFVLTMGKPLTAMPGLTREGVLGKWIWQLAEEDALPLEEIAQELVSQYQRFVELFGRKPTHIDSHHHVHMFPQIFPLVAKFAAGRALRYALTVNRLLTRATYLLICAVHRDSVVLFMAKRSVSHCSCKYLMIPVSEMRLRWRSCAIRRLLIIRFARVRIAFHGSLSWRC